MRLVGLVVLGRVCRLLTRAAVLGGFFANTGFSQPGLPPLVTGVVVVVVLINQKFMLGEKSD